MKKILVTGSAGFIGYHLVKRLLHSKDIEVVGIDNLNTYYDVNLKLARLADCGIQYSWHETAAVSTDFPNYRFKCLDIADSTSLTRLFQEENFDIVVNLAAQAGVRYSISNPESYVQSNLVGFANLLECCRHHSIKHLVYASSSSVYGMSNKVPFSESDNVDYPVSFYAATKKNNELMAHSYSHLYGLPTTGLRFFTVYGPWGRPDMAPMLFAKSIYEGSPISVFNNGDMQRDFTFVDDVVEGVLRIMDLPASDKEKHSYYQLFNIGNSQPVKLLDFIKTLESKIGRQALLNFLPMQPGDVQITYADTSKLESRTRYKPATSLDKGIGAFISWYKLYFNL